jgi:hypothetical protein
MPHGSAPPPPPDPNSSPSFKTKALALLNTIFRLAPRGLGLVDDYGTTSHIVRQYEVIACLSTVADTKAQGGRCR